MSCCGNLRRLAATSSPDLLPLSHDKTTVVPTGPTRHFVILFEYIGTTALTAIGGLTGRRYRFDRPGARVAIDPRDRPSVAQIPNLRQLSGW